MFNHPILIQLIAEDVIERHRKAAETHAAVRAYSPSGSIRKSLASYLVRLGLRLDPAAGGGPGASAPTEATRFA